MIHRKIYRIRHLKHMIYLSKRVKRTMCTTQHEKNKIDWHIKNYESLLELVQDS